MEQTTRKTTDDVTHSSLLPAEILVLLAIVVLVLAYWKTRNDAALARKLWPLAGGVSLVLLAPFLARAAGFGSRGPIKGSVASELQSLLASNGIWTPLVAILKPVVSLLQSVGAKGMGLKSVSGLFCSGGAMGYLLHMGAVRAQFLPPFVMPALQAAAPQQLQAAQQQGQRQQPQVQQPEDDHLHDE